jgi:hypothetical protein
MAGNRNNREIAGTRLIFMGFQSTAANGETVMGVTEGIACVEESGIQRECDPDAKACRPRTEEGRGTRKQGSGVMLKTAYAIVAASIIAGSFLAALSLSAQVEARGSALGAKADRADARPLAQNCSQQAWPYFEAGCLRDARNAYGQAREVRIVLSDRRTQLVVSSAR